MIKQWPHTCCSCPGSALEPSLQLTFRRSNKADNYLTVVDWRGRLLYMTSFLIDMIGFSSFEAVVASRGTLDFLMPQPCQQLHTTDWLNGLSEYSGATGVRGALVRILMANQQVFPAVMYINRCEVNEMPCYIVWVARSKYEKIQDSKRLRVEVRGYAAIMAKCACVESADRLVCVCLKFLWALHLAILFP